MYFVVRFPNPIYDSQCSMFYVHIVVGNDKLFGFQIPDTIVSVFSTSRGCQENIRPFSVGTTLKTLLANCWFQGIKQPLEPQSDETQRI